MAAFQNDFFTYTVVSDKLTQITTGTLSPVTANSALTPAATAVSVENVGTNTFQIVCLVGVSAENGANTFNWFVVN